MNESQPLIVRYTSDWPSAIFPSPMGELVYEAPRRERMMIELARQQIAAQEETARKIALSNLAGAQVIVNELNQQTGILAGEIRELEERLSDDLSETTERITYAVDRLGDRICASLDEVRWQLVQQGRTLDQILRVLTESRNNEAQQLVRQGVRLCATEEYEEAEQVFREALGKDKTDYQVLMNLAFIEIHKGNAQAAFEFFRQALQRPDPNRLNDTAKARTLWATARLHYAEGQYAEALKTADRAMTLERSPKAGALFTTAVYAALAGDRDVCLTRIRAAIETDSALFAKVAAAPNLGRMRADVLRLLSEMAASVLADARRAVDDNRRLLAQVAEGAHAASYQHLLGMAREKIVEAEKLVQVASYASCRDLVIPLSVLKEIIGQIARFEQLYDEAALAGAAVAECEPRLSEAARQLQARRSELDMLAREKASKPWFSRILSDVLRLLGSPDELAAARANLQSAERSFIFHKARLAESRGPANALDEKTASLTTMIAQQLSQFVVDSPSALDRPTETVDSEGENDQGKFPPAFCDDHLPGRRRRARKSRDLPSAFRDCLLPDEEDDQDDIPPAFRDDPPRRKKRTEPPAGML